METYTYKCPSCGAALTFDPEANMLLCDSCGMIYYPNEISSPEEKSAGTATPETYETSYGASTQNSYDSSYGASTQNSYDNTYGAPSQDSYDNTYGAPSQNSYDNTYGAAGEISHNAGQSLEDAYMQVNIYNCSSCGAELMTNDVEVSKFCSYCGQPTIMFNRVSQELKPKKIIPFSISKGQALQRAKEQFSQGKFLCDDINNLSVDSVYPIYMPYWDFTCELDMALEINMMNHEGNMIKKTPSHCGVYKILLDGSFRLNDDVAEQLNPFDKSAAVDFSPVYLSGFYADRCDVNSKVLSNNANVKIQRQMTADILSTFPGSPALSSLEHNHSSQSFRMNVVKNDFRILDATYMFCPIYFITFTIGPKTVVVLVNGSSGKVIGSIPIDENKFKVIQRKNMILFGILFSILGALFFAFLPPVWSFLFVGAFAFFTFTGGKAAKKKYETMYAKTNSEQMFNISRNREG